MSNLDQVAIVDSIGKHLDALKVTIGWALLVAIVFTGAGLTGDKYVRALGLTIDIDHAFFVAAAFYTFVNLKVLALLIRFRHLMHLLEDSELAARGGAPCKRRLSAGANPARQLSLQPVAVGADDGGNDIG